MSKRSKKNSLNNKLIAILFVSFTAGQLPAAYIKTVFPFLQSLHLLDLAALLLVGFYLPKTKKVSMWFRPLIYFLISALFSLVLSFVFLGGNLVSVLYLLRLAVYLLLAEAALTLEKEKTLKLMMSAGFAIAAIGWLQLRVLPDLRFLKNFNWDDHYYRLASSLLDPAFTGIILVLTSLVLLSYFLVQKKRVVGLLLVFSVTSVGFTYSRSSFLALILGSSYLIFKYLKSKDLKKGMAILAVAVLMIPFLPRSMGGEGVKLERLHSIFLKIDNSQEGLEMFKSSPVFGVGYNNICLARSKIIGNGDFLSHSCGGLDSSPLFILTTTGVVGFIIFSYAMLVLYKTTSSNKYGVLWKSSSLAVLTHGLFTNTFFYAWVLLWMVLLTGISRKGFREKI